MRAANARILIEQSIGPGLRLPYGKRTGVTAVDRLNIVAQDRFQMLFVLGLVHRGDVFALAESGGWALELQGMFLFTALAIACLGPGWYSVNGR